MSSTHTILLVEDNPDDVALIQRALRKANLSNPLQVVADGQAAMDYLAGVGEYADRTRYPLPALVLLDLHLPRKDGFEVLEWRRTQSELSRVPVVVLTGSKALPDILRAYALGANTYLVKPVVPAALQETVNTLLLPLGQPLRLLLIDDNADDLLLTARELRREFPNVQIEEVSTQAQILRALEAGEFDLVVSDFNAPDWSGVSNLRAVKARYLDRPVIIFTGTATQEDLIEVLGAGLDDYVLKSPPQARARLPNAVRGAIGRAWQRRAQRASEEKYRSLFANSLDAVLLTMPDGGILAANESACRIFGWTEEELCQLGRGGVVDTSDPRLASALEERARTGKFSGELTLVRKDGTKFPGELSTAIYTDQTGQKKTSMIIRDITERKRAEAELVKLRMAVETSGEAIFMTDRDGVITFFNPGFTALYGYDAAEVVGKTTPRILKSERMTPQDYEWFWQTLLSKEVVKGEIVNKTKDGRLINIESSANPILDDKGDIVGFLAIQTDITARKRAEAVLRESEERYRSLFENMLDGFAYCQMLFEDDQPQDCICLTVNRAFEGLTGLTNVVGKKVTELIPGIKESNPELFEILGRVALTGKPETLEVYLEPLGGMWLSVSVYSQEKGYFVAVFDNITNRKRAEEAIKKQLAELQRWYDATLGRETRVLDLKREVNKLLEQAGKPPRYPSAET